MEKSHFQWTNFGGAGQVTCGSLPLSYGCYGSGQLGPFTNACSIVQSVPVAINAFTVVRYIYVLDSGASPGGVTLSAYKRTDTVSQSSDTISITQVATVPLPILVGGTGVSCMMSQNPTGVFAATNQSTSAVRVNRITYEVSQIGSAGGNVSSITADSYGFVVIVWGQQVFLTYDPESRQVENGGGDYYMINPINGMTPANYPFDLSAPPPQVGWWPQNLP